MENLNDHLSFLKKKALADVKEALNKLGRHYVLPETITLYVDPCNNSGFLYNLEAKKVFLDGNTIVILSEKNLDREQDIRRSAGCGLDIQPDECWIEGCEWSVDLTNLFILFDQIVAESKREKLYIATIAEHDENDDLFCAIISEKSKEKVMEQVNNFFEEEKNCGHEVPYANFKDYDDLNGFTSYDIYQSNKYHIMTCEKTL